MVAFYYYLLAVPVLGFSGLLSHLSRGLFNVFPDRGYTNTPRDQYSFTDDLLSGNYDFSDYLVGTKYDENGYYDLTSLRNIGIACRTNIVGGMIAMIIDPDVAAIFKTIVDFSASWLWDLILFRLANLQLV